MANTKTCKDVLADISAMKTLVEHFPMSLIDGLDLNAQGQYSSAFDFLMDVLKSCGLTTDELIRWLIVKIFGVNKKTMDEDLNENAMEFVDSINFEEFEQSTLMKTMETGIKNILMAMLSSLYSCSALPIIPNQVFDSDNLSGGTGVLMNRKFGTEKLKDMIDNRVFDQRANYPLKIPVRLIDKFDLLNVNPLSEEGIRYYAVEGKYTYFHKEEVEVESGVTVEATKTGVEEVVEENDKYWKNNSLKIIQAGEPNKWRFELASAVTTDLKIAIEYIDCVNPDAGTIKKEVVIDAGSHFSISFVINSFYEEAYTKITSLTVNGHTKYAVIGNESDSTKQERVFFDSTNMAETVGEQWYKEGWNEDLFWGTAEQANAEKTYEKTKKEVVSGETITKSITKNVLKYVPCEKSAIPSGETISYLMAIPKEVGEKDPDYIYSYSGITPDTLYETEDMNAFIWYVLNRGNLNPYVEYNHMMWDSRIPAKKDGVKRETQAEWNAWYQSKASSSTKRLAFPDGEFTFDGKPSDILYPILQMEAAGKGVLKLHIPSQRYYAPKVRKRILNNQTIPPKMPYLHSSIYRFNWEYLQSIKILHPKLLVVKMLEFLLGFSLSTTGTLNLTMTKKIIQGKLSEAIKKIVEADDMQVEDCYFTFTNDEYNQLMEDMLLSKYGATHYGGEASKVRVHDINSYLSSLDKINNTATPEGTVETITKLVTEVTADPGTEPTIEYGMKANYDGNILKQLLWGITEPIIESLFTPQVMLLLYINFNLTGMVKTENFFGIDAGAIINSMLNKLLGLMKSIILLVKDMIVQELVNLFKTTIAVILIQWQALRMDEQLKAWRKLLEETAQCITGIAGLLNGRRDGLQASIDDVDYADIITEETQDIPETSSEC